MINHVPPRKRPFSFDFVRMFHCVTHPFADIRQRRNSPVRTAIEDVVRNSEARNGLELLHVDQIAVSWVGKIQMRRPVGRNDRNSGCHAFQSRQIPSFSSGRYNIAVTRRVERRNLFISQPVRDQLQNRRIIDIPTMNHLVPCAVHLGSLGIKTASVIGFNNQHDRVRSRKLLQIRAQQQVVTFTGNPLEVGHEDKTALRPC